MADLRIVDAPEIPTENITGEEKLPTGGSGNYSISLDSLADYTKTKKDLADNTAVDSKVNGVRQELDAHIEDLTNPHQVTKVQIGLGNVDNTADADKPVSNSTQAAIISAVATKADKNYVDTQLAVKANKADVYTKQESSDLVNNNIYTALTPVNTSLDLAKRGIANRYDSSLTYNSGERVVLTNSDIVKSTINGNTNNPNVDMTGWVKTNSASQVFDESGKTQQELNDTLKSKYVSVSDYENISSALSAISSRNAILLLKSGEIYTLDNTPTQFLSQVESVGNPATIVIPSNVKLTTNGKNLVLKNVNLNILGHRVGVNDSSKSGSFVYDYAMPVIDSVDIQDVKVYGLTSAIDQSSWVDDIGETRCAGFLNVKVNKSFRLVNIEHCGFSSFINAEANNSTATHVENNVVGYNCETGLYFRLGSCTWASGESRTIGIKNTPENRSYWVGKSAGVLTNGKNALLVGAEHTIPIFIDNVFAISPIEKCLYNQSKQARVSNLYDEDSLQIGQTKHSKSDKEGVATELNVVAVNPRNLTGLIDVNGYNKYTLDTVVATNSVKNKARVFVIRDLGECLINNVTLTKMGTIVTANGDKPIDKITFSNMTLNDCYNSDAPSFFWRYQPDVATYLISELNVINVKNNLSSDVVKTALSNNCFQLDNVSEVLIKDSNFQCRTLPFISYSQNTLITVDNAVFDVYSVNNCYSTLNSLNTAVNNFKASVFNMVVNTYPTDSIVSFLSLSLKKSTNNGLVYCFPHWKSITANLSLSSVSSTNIVPLVSTDSFKIIATSGSSRIELIVDMSTKANTILSNIGTVFSGTKADNKICFSVDSSNRLNVDVGNSLTWTQGVANISLVLQK